ncbi:MAG: pyrroline-5-carboxylate reductase [Pseudomonadota bacterium]|nr:pyrroline-5-carboxylate reductase [Pseudomonadota bacterium]
MTLSNKVLLVGGGKMGSAMLRGWLSKGLETERVRVVEPDTAVSRAIDIDLAVSVVPNIQNLDSNFTPDVIVLAVKPQGMSTIVPHYAKLAQAGAVTVSIAAGRTVEFLERYLGRDTAIVRTMPNTPAAIGRGITAAYPNRYVSINQKKSCHSLLEAMGEVVWISEEAQIDSVTAISGSGPAYVFLLIECLAAAARKQGLPDEVAAKLALVTVSGAGELALRSDEDASVLRQNVTSPGGTTAAALEVLMSDEGIENLMLRAVEVAAARSRDLAEYT